MIKHNLDQRGGINPLLIPLIIAVVSTLTLGIVSVIYYNQFIDQRDRNQPKIEAAVAEAEEKQKTKLEAEFTEREKQPNRIYTSPQEFGTVTFNYPKTWSSYVDNKTAGKLEFYAHPNYVPSTGINYALRMSVVNQQFAQEIKQYDQQVKKGDMQASAVQVVGVTGTRLTGLLKKDQEVSMVIFPLRDKTMRVWTENKDFYGDFDNIVLKSLNFVP